MPLAAGAHDAPGWFDSVAAPAKSLHSTAFPRQARTRVPLPCSDPGGGKRRVPGLLTIARPIASLLRTRLLNPCLAAGGSDRCSCADPLRGARARCRHGAVGQAPARDAASVSRHSILSASHRETHRQPRSHRKTQEPERACASFERADQSSTPRASSPCGSGDQGGPCVPASRLVVPERHAWGPVLRRWLISPMVAGVDWPPSRRSVRSFAIVRTPRTGRFPDCCREGAREATAERSPENRPLYRRFAT